MIYNMKISDIAKEVREGNLSKDRLESYYDDLTGLYAQLEERMGELEKKEAIFLNECGEKTRAGAEMKWNITVEGQESIETKHNIRALSKLLSSIKHRIYNTY